jgi:hypothetical protein
MPGKYRIEATISLSTSIGPQSGYVSGIEDEGIEDFEDSSQWDEEYVSVGGGVVDFTVEADSEDEAREMADRAVANAYYEGDDIEWEIADYSISSVECIEEPMDLAKAKDIFREFLRRNSSVLSITDQEQAAFDFLLELLTP